MTIPGGSGHPDIPDEVRERLRAEADNAALRAEKAGENPEQDLMALAEELALLSETIADDEAALKLMKARRDQLRKIDIPDRMRAAGMVTGNKGSFTFRMGRVSLSTRTYASMKEGEHSQLFEWLRNNNMGELIKETISGSALGAIVRERRDDGEGDPPHVAVYEETAATITKVK